MGLYATLNASVSCPTCGNANFAGWQFYFGNVSQLPEYSIGDTVSWGGDDRGAPSMRDVIAVAHFDGADHFCIACNTEHALANVHIVDHVIQSIAFRSNEPWLKHTLFVGPERTPYSSEVGG